MVRDSALAEQGKRNGSGRGDPCTAASGKGTEAMNRKRATLAAACVLAVVPSIATADSPRDRATGGGQAFFSGEPAGAGDTVAFTAQRAKAAANDEVAANGQIQVNRRTTGVTKFHGTITCLVVTGGKSEGAAYMSGTSRASKTQPAQSFELYVTDGGKGAMERDDTIALFVGDETDQGDDNRADDGPCGIGGEPDDLDVDLARGNVQTHNASTEEEAEFFPAEEPAPVSGLTLPPLG